MPAVFQAALAAVVRGEKAVVACVIETEGPTPRRVGAKMAVFEDGSMFGTVGGGAMEHFCVRWSLELMAGKGPSVRRFSLDKESLSGPDIACESKMMFALHCFTAEDIPFLSAYSSLEKAAGLPDHGERPPREELPHEAARSGKEPNDAWLVIACGEDACRMGLYDSSCGLRFLRGIPAAQLKSALAAHPMLIKLPGDADMLYLEPAPRRDRVYIFGGGHVARALIPVLIPLSFNPICFEDRPDYALGGVLGNFARIGDNVQIGSHDYVVIITRGHRSDLLVLAQALRTPACYIGMIGSTRKVAATREALRVIGFGDDDWARVHSPIGLPIGADTPAEIAVSIAAEMIAFRAKARAGAKRA